MTELMHPPGLPGKALVATKLVTIAEYKTYLQAVGQPVPRLLVRGHSPNGPATHVSQVDAAACCQWLGRQEGHAYRLPSMAELIALHNAPEETGAEGWPALTTHSNPACDEHGCHCEWTCETETTPAYEGGEPSVLGSVFYPPWLRPGSSAIHAQAHLCATDGFSFVGFRVASDD